MPRRWATQPALTANAPAMVAAMPSCCPCLVDGRHNLLSLRTPQEALAKGLPCILATSASPTGDTTCSHCERSKKPLRRDCEGSCHAFLLLAPHRRATQPALTANAPAKVALICTQTYKNECSCSSPNEKIFLCKMAEKITNSGSCQTKCPILC